MTLIKWQKKQDDPFQDLLGIQNEVNRLFDFSLGRWSASPSSWAPAMDILQNKDHIVVKAEIPGMDEKDVEITLEGSTLQIKGEKKYEKEEKEEDRYHSERFYGKFQRVVELPSDVATTAVKATYRQGVLEVILPKREELKPKQIKVEVGK